jgi:hypothetical protein
MALRAELRVLQKGGVHDRAFGAAIEAFCGQMKSDFAEQLERHRAKGKKGAPHFLWNNRGEITATFFKLMDSFKKWHTEHPKYHKSDFKEAFTTLAEMLLEKAAITPDCFGAKKFDTKFKDWENGGTRYSGSKHLVKNVVVTEEYNLVVDDAILDTADKTSTKKDSSDRSPRTPQEQQLRDQRTKEERQYRVDLQKSREREQLLREKQIPLQEMELKLRQMVGDKEVGLLNPERDTEGFLDLFEQEEADANLKISLLNCLYKSGEAVRKRFEDRGLVNRLRSWAKHHQHPRSPVEARVLQAILKTVSLIPLSHISAINFNAGNLLGELAKSSDRLTRQFAEVAAEHFRAAKARHTASQPTHGSDDSSSSSSTSDADDDSDASAADVQITSSGVAPAKSKPIPKSAAALLKPGLRPIPKSSPATTAPKPTGPKLFDLSALSEAAEKRKEGEPPAKRLRVTINPQAEYFEYVEPTDRPDPQSAPVGPWRTRGPAAQHIPRTMSIPIPIRHSHHRPARRGIPPYATGPRPLSSSSSSSQGPVSGSPPPAYSVSDSPPPAPEATILPAEQESAGGGLPPSLGDPAPTPVASRLTVKVPIGNLSPPQVFPERDPRLEKSNLPDAPSLTPPPYSAPTLTAVFRELHLEVCPGGRPGDPEASRGIQEAIRQARRHKPYQCSTQEEYEEKMKEFREKELRYEEEMQEYLRASKPAD